MTELENKITELAQEFPNDMELGQVVRDLSWSIADKYKKDPNQLELEFPNNIT